MFIQTEETPNPRTLKFIPGILVMEHGTASFTDRQAAKHSPLAEALFHIDGVEGVFLGHDFITVTRHETISWEAVKAFVLTTIMEHFLSGRPVLHDQEQTNVMQRNTMDIDDDEIVKQIKELIDTRVRPAVAEDGGDIVYHNFVNGIVQLEMHGACAGCPSSTATLKQGIENMLKHYIPEVMGVEAV